MGQRAPPVQPPAAAGLGAAAGMAVCMQTGHQPGTIPQEQDQPQSQPQPQLSAHQARQVVDLLALLHTQPTSPDQAESPLTGFIRHTLAHASPGALAACLPALLPLCRSKHRACVTSAGGHVGAGDGVRQDAWGWSEGVRGAFRQLVASLLQLSSKEHVTPGASAAATAAAVAVKSEKCGHKEGEEEGGPPLHAAVRAWNMNCNLASSPAPISCACRVLEVVGLLDTLLAHLVSQQEQLQKTSQQHQPQQQRQQAERQHRAGQQARAVHQGQAKEEDEGKGKGVGVKAQKVQGRAQVEVKQEEELSPDGDLALHGGGDAVGIGRHGGQMSSCDPSPPPSASPPLPPAALHRADRSPRSLDGSVGASPVAALAFSAAASPVAGVVAGVPPATLLLRSLQPAPDYDARPHEQDGCGLQGHGGGGAGDGGAVGGEHEGDAHGSEEEHTRSRRPRRGSTGPVAQASALGPGDKIGNSASDDMDVEGAAAEEEEEQRLCTGVQQTPTRTAGPPSPTSPQGSRSSSRVRTKSVRLSEPGATSAAAHLFSFPAATVNTDVASPQLLSKGAQSQTQVIAAPSPSAAAQSGGRGAAARSPAGKAHEAEARRRGRKRAREGAESPQHATAAAAAEAPRGHGHLKIEGGGVAQVTLEEAGQQGEQQDAARSPVADNQEGAQAQPPLVSPPTPAVQLCLDIAHMLSTALCALGGQELQLGLAKHLCKGEQSTLASLLACSYSQNEQLQAQIQAAVFTTTLQLMRAVHVLGMFVQPPPLAAALAHLAGMQAGPWGSVDVRGRAAEHVHKELFRATAATAHASPAWPVFSAWVQACIQVIHLWCVS